MARWETVKEPLEDDNVVDTLTERLSDIAFESAVGESVYVVDIERNNANSITITMSDGTKFEMICNKLGE
jgi:hypothetical protein